MTAAQGDWLLTAGTVAAAVAGGAAFSALSVPVAWLSGPMIVVAGLAMAGAPVRLTPLMRDFGLLVAGVSLGSTVTPEALQTIARYPWSLVGLTISVIATVAASKAILEKVYGWDRSTAYLAAVPGALSMVMALAAQSSGDTRRIAMVQAIRLFSLVSIMPPLINATAEAMPLPRHETVSAGAMAVLFAGALMLSQLMRRLKFANPLFMGGLITSTVLHVGDVISGELPDVLAISGLLLVGVFAGLRFAGARPRDLAACLVPGLTSLSVALVMSFALGYLVALGTGLPLAAVLVAFAPGGLEAMVMVGAAMGLDMLYISTHHVFRAVALNIVTPFFAPAEPDRD